MKNSYFSGLNASAQDSDKKTANNETEYISDDSKPIIAAEDSKPKKKKKKKKKNARPPKKPLSKKRIVTTIILSVIVVCILSFGIWGYHKFFMPPVMSDSQMSDNRFISFSPENIDIAVTDADSAIAAIASIGENIGITDVNRNLSLDITTKSENNTFYRLSQVYKGLPVYGRSMVVMADENGKVNMITGNYYTQDIDTTPKITAEEATQAAKKYFVKEYSYKEETIESNAPELVIYDMNNTKSALAYRINMYCNEDLLSTRELFINAVTKKVICNNDVILNGEEPVTCDFMGATGKTRSINLTYDSDWEKYILKNDTFSFLQLVNNQVASPETDGRFPYEIHDGDDTYRQVLWSTEPAEEQKTGVDAMYNLLTSYNFYYQLGYQQATTQIAIINVEKDLLDNAAYSASADSFLFGKKHCFTYPSGSYLELAGHEYTHSVIWLKSGLSHEEYTEPRALHEGISDVMGELVNHFLSGEINWIQDNFNRNMITPSKSKNSNYLSNYSNYGEKQDSYKASTIISHAAYLMWKGYSGFGYTAGNSRLSEEQIATLWYRTICSLSSDSTFAQFRNNMTAIARIMFEQGELNKAQVECISRAFDDVGIPIMNNDEIISVNGLNSIMVIDVAEKLYSNYHIKIFEIETKGLIFKKTTQNLIIDEDVMAQLFFPHLDKGKYIIEISDIATENRKSVVYTKKITVSELINIEKIYPLIIHTNYGATEDVAAVKAFGKDEAKQAAIDAESKRIANEILDGFISKIRNIVSHPFFGVAVYIAIISLAFALLIKAVCPGKDTFSSTKKIFDFIVGIFKK